MPQMHSTTHLGYGPVISPTGVACLCSTAAPAPPGLIPCSFGSQPENRFLFQGSPLALLSARMTGGPRPFQRCPKRKGDWSLSLNIPIGHVWRSDLTQIRRWTQTQAPSAPRAAIRCFFSSSRQVLSGDAALNEGDGLVAEIATSLPIAQSKRIE